jgi:hypothetical protein
MSNENYDIFIEFYSNDNKRYSIDIADFKYFILIYNKLFIKSFPQFNNHYEELSSKIRTCRDNILQEFIKIFPNCDPIFLKNQIIEYAHYKENITYTYLVDLKNEELKALNLNESVILYGLFLILDKPDDEGFKKRRKLILDKIDANGFKDISIFVDIRNLLKYITNNKGIYYIIDIISHNKLAIKRFEEKCKRQPAPVVEGVPIPSPPRNRSRKENNMKQKGPVVPIPIPPKNRSRNKMKQTVEGVPVSSPRRNRSRNKMKQTVQGVPIHTPSKSRSRNKMKQTVQGVPIPTPPSPPRNPSRNKMKQTVQGVPIPTPPSPPRNPSRRPRQFKSRTSSNRLLGQGTKI